MRNWHRSLLALMFLFTLGLPSFNAKANAEEAEPALREEAQAMCEKAAALIQSEGIEKAKAAFQDRSGQFFDNKHYVFVLDNSGKIIAHGSEPLLIGLNGYNLRDLHGMPFIRAIMKITDKGWVDYNWGDPADGYKIKPKSSYIIHMQDYFVGVGYYKEKSQ